MSFVADRKRAESMIKDNATAFYEAENMLLGSKDKSLNSKHSWFKKLFASIKNQG